MHRGWTWAFAVALGVSAGCASLFGIDDPPIDPCAGGGCADGSGVDVVASDATTDGGTEASPPDAVSDAPADAPANEGSPPPVGAIRCGGGAFKKTYCTDASICCASTDDAGAPTFECVGASGCAAADYPIWCASAADCEAGESCCRYTSAMKCEPGSPCPGSGGTVVCDPTVDGGCPSGKTCNGTVEDPRTDGSLPYTQCQ
jgi:hypothetical protein